ncbi:MAG: sterol desaturase family protein [Pseudomonadota bacterium]
MLTLIFIESFFLFFVGVEILLARRKNIALYDFPDTIKNIILNWLAIGVESLIKGWGIVFLLIFQRYAICHVQMNLLGWCFLAVAQDFSYYCRHVCEHKLRIMWAVHSVHHSSTVFNLSTSMRRSVFQGFYRPIFFIPLVIIGFQPIDIGIVYAASQVYTFFLHTKLISRLPFFEKFLITPSLHRVHHGRNKKYIDKNFGQVLSVWDRLFGTFAVEDKKVIFGVYGQPGNGSVYSIIFTEWINIYHDVKNKIKKTFSIPRVSDRSIKENEEFKLDEMISNNSK